MALPVETREFQSTRPVRGATGYTPDDRETYVISIHAPRAGRDVLVLRYPLGPEIISIHAPRAGRDNINQIVQQSGTISIHAPRAGRDLHT